MRQVSQTAEQRAKFLLPTEWDVVTTLSGESERILRAGLIIPIQATRGAKVGGWRPT